MVFWAGLARSFRNDPTHSLKTGLVGIFARRKSDDPQRNNPKTVGAALHYVLSNNRRATQLRNGHREPYWKGSPLRGPAWVITMANNYEDIHGDGPDNLRVLIESLLDQNKNGALFTGRDLHTQIKRNPDGILSKVYVVGAGPITWSNPNVFQSLPDSDRRLRWIHFQHRIDLSDLYNTEFVENMLAQSPRHLVLHHAHIHRLVTLSSLMTGRKFPDSVVSVAVAVDYPASLDEKQPGPDIYRKENWFPLIAHLLKQCPTTLTSIRLQRLQGPDTSNITKIMLPDHPITNRCALAVRNACTFELNIGGTYCLSDLATLWDQWRRTLRYVTVQGDVTEPISFSIRPLGGVTHLKIRQVPGTVGAVLLGKMRELSSRAPRGRLGH